MSELGQQLREARLQKGMSLDDVQEVTKIRKRYLEAIEAGDYKVLPGSFYVRAFIKTYAEAVGINPDELLEGHKQDVPKPEPAEATMEPVMQKRSSRASSDRSISWLPTALMWTFPILIIAVIYIYASQSNSDVPDKVPPVTQTDPSDQGEAGGDTPVPNPGGAQGDGGSSEGTEADPGTEADLSEKPDGEEQDPEEENKPDDQPGQVTVTEDRKEGKNVVFKVAASGNTPVKVEIKASGQSWVEVYRGYNSTGEKLSFGMMNEGDSVSFDLDEQGMYVKSGYSPATVITVGGQTVTDGKTSSRLLFEPATAEDSAADGTEGTGTEVE
ncbi:helix-turn-helix domain-containing protein [Paenibacillus dakarensis]|uniref:helix-turn-helix domain-containing protein n=1 Tax=Paenibacillus dakarensis TaxID=1527293 RepID=UPI0006D54C3E|nr:RodZ domain-containing protein [Paenibacillus dakarensis]